jgi:hypothetical protein
MVLLSAVQVGNQIRYTPVVAHNHDVVRFLFA